MPMATSPNLRLQMQKARRAYYRQNRCRGRFTAPSADLSASSAMVIEQTKADKSAPTVGRLPTNNSYTRYRRLLMATQVILPALGMAQETGIIVRWLKEEGEEVAKGEPLVEIETDKATLEIEASASGILVNVTGNVGVEIPVGQVIASIIDSEEFSQENTLAKGGTAYRNTTSDGHAPPQYGDRLPSVTASPLAARIAPEPNLDMMTINQSGKHLQRSDVPAHIHNRRTACPMIT